MQASAKSFRKISPFDINSCFPCVQNTKISTLPKWEEIKLQISKAGQIVMIHFFSQFPNKRDLVPLKSSAKERSPLQRLWASSPIFEDHLHHQTTATCWADIQLCVTFRIVPGAGAWLITAVHCTMYGYTSEQQMPCYVHTALLHVAETRTKAAFSQQDVLARARCHGFPASAGNWMQCRQA